MDTIFRSKHRTRTSASSAPSTSASSNGLSSSVPYNQLPSIYSTPTAGPSTSTISLLNGRRDQAPRKEDVSAPLQNPGLNDVSATDEQAVRLDGMMPPPSARRSERERESSRRSNMTESAGGNTPEGSIRRATSDLSPSNGLRYVPPSITLGMGRSPSDNQEFGSSSRHPYAASAHRDSDVTSIRTVSSVSSQQPIRDLGRYPSFGDSRVSLTNRNSHSTPNGRDSRAGPSKKTLSIHSIGSTVALARPTEEFDFPRPPDTDTEQLFQQLLENRDLDSSHSQVPSISSRNSLSSMSQSNIAKTTALLPIETKWQMVESDARARWEQQREMRRKEEDLVKSGRTKRGTAGDHVKNSPEWFLKKVLDGTLTTQHLTTLNVSLRTLPLE